MHADNVLSSLLGTEENTLSVLTHKGALQQNGFGIFTLYSSIALACYHVSTELWFTFFI